MKLQPKRFFPYRHPYRFAFWTIATLTIAVAIGYHFGAPMLDHITIRCGRPGSRNVGCATGAGTFFSLLIAVTGGVIAAIWNKLR
jgi:hypothetical protein